MNTLTFQYATKKIIFDDNLILYNHFLMNIFLSSLKLNYSDISSVFFEILLCFSSIYDSSLLELLPDVS